MKRKRISVEQIVAVLKQAELGIPVAELTQLQEENVRLKKLITELSLDKAIPQDINAKQWPGRR